MKVKIGEDYVIESFVELSSNTNRIRMDLFKVMSRKLRLLYWDQLS